MINGKCYGISKYLINLLAIVVTLNCSAYCHTGNPTASGVMPAVGMCAVDKINGWWVGAIWNDYQNQRNGNVQGDRPIWGFTE